MEAQTEAQTELEVEAQTDLEVEKQTESEVETMKVNRGVDGGHRRRRDRGGDGDIDGGRD